MILKMISCSNILLVIIDVYKRQLQIIAKNYHKRIVIASHERYVKNNCDVLYEIENCRLVLKTQSLIKENVSMLKNDTKILSLIHI